MRITARVFGVTLSLLAGSVQAQTTGQLPNQRPSQLPRPAPNSAFENVPSSPDRSATGLPDCRTALLTPFGGSSPIIENKVLPRILSPEIQGLAREIAANLKDEPVTPEDTANPPASLDRLGGLFLRRMRARMTSPVEQSWFDGGFMSAKAVVSCFPDLWVAMRAYAPRVKEAADAANEAQKERDGRTQAAHKAREDALAARGYRLITVEAFVLDGRELAGISAKVALRGFYVREGDLDVLYPNRQALLMARYNHLNQINALLLTQEASRALRQHLLMCQSNAATAQTGCPIEIKGQVTKCTVTNAFGREKETPCVAVSDEWD